MSEHVMLCECYVNVNPKSTQNRSKISPKSIQTWFRGAPWGPISRRDRFRHHFGPNLGACWGPSWGHVAAMLVEKSIFSGSWRLSKTTMISNALRDPLGTDFGAIWEPKIEPKIGPRSDSRAIKTQMWKYSKPSAGPMFLEIWGGRKSIKNKQKIAMCESARRRTCLKSKCWVFKSHRWLPC